VTLSLGPRHGHVTPTRQGFCHTGAGTIDVAQPAPDTLVITMSGVAVAGGHPVKDSVAALHFDLCQELEIAVADPNVKRVKLSLEGRVIGLLRSHGKGGGCAEQGAGTVTLGGGPTEIISLTVPPHSVAGGENLSVNCREGPVETVVGPGKYTLHNGFSVTASHRHSVMPCKAASAEFAPEPALDPLWISYWEPFHGAAKKDFGYQVIVRVVPDNHSAGDSPKP
jgi:hypothetical protein